MLLMIDNYDSFTYNVVQYLRELGAEVVVVKNDQCSLADIAAMGAERIVISPGPCTPKEAGVSCDVITKFAGKVPILGVCLGHQCIGEVYGAQVVRAGQVMHGKTSRIYHEQQGVFAGIEGPFMATRYHSLVIAEETLPSCLEVTAWTQDEDETRQEIMGIQHKSLLLQGVQFHPESILSEHGHQLFDNFLTDE